MLDTDNSATNWIDHSARKPDTASMNLRVVILVLSAIGNVVLASIIVRQRPTATVADTVTATSSATPAADSQATQAGQTITGLDAGLIPATPNNDSSESESFRWSQLEAADYKEYIARLRAFGVPEKVVRDIIIADVNKLYRPRYAALLPPKKPANPNFWENRNNYYNRDRDMTKEQREQTAALRKEQTNLIKELLGADVYEQISKESGYPDYTERMYGTLDKEQREKISDMQQKFQEEQSAIYAKADGYIDQDTQKELEALRKKHRAELATVLTPEQLEEYELRSSQTSQTMRWELSSFEPDEKEFRAIHNYKQAMDELNSSRSDDEEKPLTAEEQKARRDKQKALDESLATSLGTNRVAEYKLMSNYEYRNLFEAGVAKETVMKIPDMKKEAESAAAKIRKDNSLTQEQKNAALKAIKTETSQALAEMLGDRRAKYYQQSGGWWLRNLAPSEDQ
jgi:hypothetical protein